MKISETYRNIKDRFKGVFNVLDDYNDSPPKQNTSKEDSNGVGRYASSLWEDGMKSFQNSFASTKDSTRFGYSSPEEFYQACSKLESGQHYEVYPSRTAGVGNEWKQELIDNEIQKQIRAKKNHITANWHDIIISPNIVGINEIFDQERKQTHWSENVREWVSYAQNFGDVTVRSVLDKTENPVGVATEITCLPGSVVRTPESNSFKKIDGCTYAVHGQRVNDSWVRKNYPKFDITLSDSGATPKFLQIDADYKDTHYTNTKMFNKLEVFLDDESLEEIPFDKEEFDQRIGQMMANIQAGEMNQVVPKEEDNHKRYIKEYLDWLQEKTEFYQNVADEAFNNGGNLSPDDTALMNSVVSAVDEQVNMHESLQSKDLEATGLPDGKRKKYPFGRHIVTLNGVLAEDKPSEFVCDWRMLFHELKNEKVPNRKDGRGDVEILWQDNRILDTMLSRDADDSLLATHKKPWFKVSEKAQIEEVGYSTNPLVPGYYVETPPTFRTGEANQQYIRSYQIVKGAIKESLSINNVTRGESSFSGESGSHAEALLNQNTTMVVGELNQNLNDFLEDIVETRIELWKQFYTEERPYIINGQQVMLILAEHLRQMPVEDKDGNVIYKEIGRIEVAVRADSNFPNRDEAEINILERMSKVLNEDGLPVVPSTMILDYIGKKFNGLAIGGKYRQDSQLMAIGKKALEQQQIAMEQKKIEDEKNAEPIESIKRKVQNKLTSDAANRILQKPVNGIQ